MLDQLDPNDILLADCYYCSYFMIALLLERNVDFVARLHHARDEDAYQIKRLGKKDYLIEWQRPTKPTWMDQETYDRMPESLTLRQIEVNVSEPGFRVESLVIVTTLTDAKEYSKDDMAELYRRRWLVELDIRAIKCNLGMDVLRCKSPEMVRKEIWTCLLAYNLIRKTMLQAAKESGDRIATETLKAFHNRSAMCNAFGVNGHAPRYLGCAARPQAVECNASGVELSAQDTLACRPTFS